MKRFYTRYPRSYLWLVCITLFTASYFLIDYPWGLVEIGYVSTVSFTICLFVYFIFDRLWQAEAIWYVNTIAIILCIMLVCSLKLDSKPFLQVYKHTESIWFLIDLVEFAILLSATKWKTAPQVWRTMIGYVTQYKLFTDRPHISTTGSTTGMDSDNAH